MTAQSAAYYKHSIFPPHNHALKEKKVFRIVSISSEINGSIRGRLV